MIVTAKILILDKTVCMLSYFHDFINFEDPCMCGGHFSYPKSSDMKKAAKSERKEGPYF